MARVTEGSRQVTRVLIVMLGEAGNPLALVTGNFPEIYFCSAYDATCTFLENSRGKYFDVFLWKQAQYQYHTLKIYSVATSSSE